MVRCDFPQSKLPTSWGLVMFLCWSAKGGSGTTVVAAALALVLARQHPALLVDLAGDVPAALGMPQPCGPGVADWLASPTADAPALHRLGVPANDALQVVPTGTANPANPAVPAVDRWPQLAVALVQHAGAVVIDAGTGSPPPALLAAATTQLLVTRPCYLALRRAVAAGVQPTGVVLVGEPGRALDARDIERALSAPVVARVEYDPAVARAVDAGLLAARLPRSLAHALQQLT